MKGNILVINAHDLNCGAGISCAITLEILADAGYNIIHIARFKGKIEQRLLKKGIPTIYCDFPGWYPQAINGTKMSIFKRIRYFQHSLRTDIKSTSTLCKKLKSLNFHPDIIYTNTILWPQGLHLAHIYNIPHIYHIREYGYADFNMYFAFGERLSSFVARKYTVKALCISKGVLSTWNKFFGGKVELLYNGVPNNNTKFVRHKFDGYNLRIVIVGRLSKEKGQEFVIRRLAEIRKKTECNIYLDLYGTGVDEEKLRNIVTELKLSDCVNFCGFSDNIDYTRYHIAIMSSLSEGFGRTTVEYMLNSVPVIGYNGGATPELLKDKYTGRLYNNSKQFDTCVIDALNTYSDYERYAKKAFEYAYENYTINVYKRNILQCFNKITKK